MGAAKIHMLVAVLLMFWGYGEPAGGAGRLPTAVIHAAAASPAGSAPSAASPATTALKIRPTQRRPAAPSAPPHSRAIRFPQAALPAAREPSSKVRSRQPSNLGRLGRRHRRRERAPRPPELLILRRALSLAKDGWQLGKNLRVDLGTDLPAAPVPNDRRPELGPWRIPNPQQIAEQSKGGRLAALYREAELCSKPLVCFAYAPFAPFCADLSRSSLLVGVTSLTPGH